MLQSVIRNYVYNYTRIINNNSNTDYARLTENIHIIYV